MNLPSGTLLQGGKYRIERVLGQGGFGITYLATQVMLNRQVAIKEFFMKDFCLRDEHTHTVTTPSTGSGKQVEQYRAKFVKEARALASLNHPHIIGIIDIFEENGTVYYSMPYLPKGSLSEVVKQSGALDETTALRYIEQVASALRYMHRDKHQCHYDIKPANILLDDNGNAQLIDFGISKNYDSTGHETSSTPVGLSEGYAPIEQYQGQVQEFSPECDVYALGATSYYLLTGQRPATAIDRISGADLSFPDSISTSTRQMIESAMTISRKSRPSSVDIFLPTTATQDKKTSQPPTEPDPDDTKLIHEEEQPPLHPQQPIEAVLEIPDEGTDDLPASDSPTSNPDAEKKGYWIAGLLTAAIIAAVVWWAWPHSNSDLADSSDAVALNTDSILQQLVEDMVYVAGGTFTMGATAEQGSDADSDEKPAHRVTLSGYHIGKYEVTQAQWRAVMGTNPSDFKGDNLPVENVSWHDCIDFIDKLNQLTGKNFRLPTEAEWEYAARGGAKSRGYKYAGSNTLGDVAWYAGNSGGKTHPVGTTKSPNELGLYDMSGNVWEWCQDWYGSDYYSNSASTNPTGPSSGSLRVYRGGGWLNYAGSCRVSFRFDYAPTFTFNDLGLRLAL